MASLLLGTEHSTYSNYSISANLGFLDSQKVFVPSCSQVNPPLRNLLGAQLSTSLCREKVPGNCSELDQLRLATLQTCKALKMTDFWTTFSSVLFSGSPRGPLNNLVHSRLQSSFHLCLFAEGEFAPAAVRPAPWQPMKVITLAERCTSVVLSFECRAVK